jgi:hypothetical protein
LDWTCRRAPWIEIRRFVSARQTKKQTGHNSSAKVNCAAADRFRTDIHLNPRDATGTLNGENAWKRSCQSPAANLGSARIV